MDEKEVLSVLIVSSSDKANKSLTAFFPTIEYSPVMIATNANEAKRYLLSNQIDIVVINTPLSDEFGLTMALNIAEDNPTTGVMIMVKSEQFDQVSYKCEDVGVLTLSKPITKASFMQTIRLIKATRARLRAFERKTETLEAKMEEIRLVNRAKLLLIEHLKLSEKEAHRYIEKSAMDNCVKRASIAKNIISTYEN